MGINIYETCWRGRTDCTSIHCIPSEPEGITEEQYYERDYVPLAFVCCGTNTPTERVENQDRYRLCFKNDVIDEMTDNDMQDLTTIMSVISAALNWDAIMKVNHGIVEVPAANEGAGIWPNEDSG